MLKEFKDSDKIKELFQHVLNSEVRIKDNIDITSQSAFSILIENLMSSISTENALLDVKGINLDKVVEPLWFVLESLFTLSYGEDNTDIIMWYLYERMNDDGSINPLLDGNGDKHMLNNTNDLWTYMYSSKNYDIDDIDDIDDDEDLEN